MMAAKRFLKGNQINHYYPAMHLIIIERSKAHWIFVKKELIPIAFIREIFIFRNTTFNNLSPTAYNLSTFTSNIRV